MSHKLERRFADWNEYQQEFDANLKNFGLFLPGASQLQLRQKVDIELWLPGAQLPLPARAEVVAVFPSGAALHLENGPEILKQVSAKEQQLRQAVAAKTVSPPASPEAGKSLEAELASAPEITESLAPEPEPEEEAEEETAEESPESAEEIERKVSLSGADYSNLYQAVRKLSRPEKIKLAKRGNRKYLTILIQEGDRMLIRFVLQNPHLSAVEVLQLLKNPQLTTENINELARNPAFAQNEEIRYQIVIHPKTPLPTAMSLLVSLNPRQLGLIAKSKHMRHQLKASALKLVLKRQTDAFDL
jgi:hypothetical protein